MKAILEYDMDSIDDRISHLRAVKSLDLVLAISDIVDHYRSVDKYGKDPLTRDELHRMLSDRSISLEELLN